MFTGLFQLYFFLS